MWSYSRLTLTLTGWLIHSCCGGRGLILWGCPKSGLPEAVMSLGSCAAAPYVGSNRDWSSLTTDRASWGETEVALRALAKAGTALWFSLRAGEHLQGPTAAPPPPARGTRAWAPGTLMQTRACSALLCSAWLAAGFGWEQLSGSLELCKQWRSC